MKSQTRTLTNYLKYTDPTGYQRESAPGASNWLGGGGGMGESGTSHLGDNVDWNYFDAQNRYTNWRGASVAFNDDPPVDLYQEAISEIQIKDTYGDGYMLIRVPGGFSIVGYWDKKGDHYAGMFNNSNIFLVSSNGADPVEIAGKGSAGGGNGSLAMDIASGSATGFGLATSLRYKLEWEYLRQARINRAILGDFSMPIKSSLRTIRWAGSGFTIAGGIIGGVNFAMSDKSWGDYGELGISMLSTGLTLGSVTAPIGIGIGVIDAFGGFNGFYHYLDNQQNFYNNTGGIMNLINGIPSYIPLK